MFQERNVMSPGGRNNDAGLRTATSGWKASPVLGIILCQDPQANDPRMKKSDLTCPVCHAGYRRIELTSQRGAKGEFCCLLCSEVLETFDGSTDVAIRLTVQPEKTFEAPLRPQ